MTEVGLGRIASRSGTWLRSVRATDRSLLIILASVLLVVVPVVIDLARYYWSTPAGAQGPIILVTGVWLVWRERGSFRFARHLKSVYWLTLLAPLILFYLLGRSLHLLATETIAAYLIVILLGFCYLGSAAMRSLWFALVYLAFLIKPPQGVVAALTGPLQIGLSQTSVRLLALADYPVGNSGVAIQVGQYELLVAQACAGIGSLFALFAIGLLYVHLTRPAGRMHATVLLVSIIPLALLANFLRVLIIILLTYHVSDAVAQSFAHELAGLATFMLSLIGLTGLDRLLGVFARQGRQ